MDEEGREYGFTDRFRAGAELTDGALLFQFRGDGPVTLRKVESFGDGTFEQIGAVVAGPEREWVQDFFCRAFPPRANWFGEFTDAEGAVIHPIDDDEDYGYQLLIGYRITQATTPGVRSHVAVTYEYDGKTYRDEFRSRIVACPGGYRLHRCERIALSTVPDFLAR